MLVTIYLSIRRNIPEDLKIYLNSGEKNTVICYNIVPHLYQIYIIIISSSSIQPLG